jgi:hypothetical protein
VVLGDVAVDLIRRLDDSERCNECFVPGTPPTAKTAKKGREPNGSPARKLLVGEAGGDTSSTSSVAPLRPTDIHVAFLRFACPVVCWRRLGKIRWATGAGRGVMLAR